MTILRIDFETASECDLKTCGAWIYSKDPTTDVLCMAWGVENNPIEIWKRGNICPVPSLIKDLNIIIEAHNAFFERAIWTNIMVSRYGWPEIPEYKWQCSAAITASYGLPRKLETVAEVLKLKNQKDPRGQKLILKMNGKNRKELTPDEFNALCEYCKQDVEVERELSERLGRLSEKEHKTWSLDQRINFHGVHFDRKTIRSAIKIMSGYTDSLKEEVKTLTDGDLDSTNQRDRTLDWLAENGLEMKTLTKGNVAVQMTASMPPKVRRLLEIRQQLSRNSVKKFQAMLNCGDTDDGIRDCFMYHGATTGRWTGRLVQFQNLPRGVIADPDTCIELIKQENLELLKNCYPDVMGAISSCIRGMITARPGHVLIAGDYNAIETRVLFWLAGETAGLRRFKEGTDLYSDMAKDIYHAQEVSKIQRQVGKTAILGLGYQMGNEKFKSTCDLAGIEVEADLASLAVSRYREKYKAVVRFWYDIDNAAQEAMRYPERIVYIGKVQFFKKKNVLICELPSERRLYYWWPSIKENKFGRLALHFFSVDPVTKKWAEESTYGGKLVENIVQATARDILAEAMLNLAASGYNIVLHAHDEVVVEEKISTPSAMGIQMQRSPDWAEELPLKVETWVGTRYRK